ncbi:MAG: hypothetical protein ACPG4N_08650 [Gammaproteobacteria bacterium]
MTDKRNDQGPGLGRPDPKEPDPKDLNEWLDALRGEPDPGMDEQGRRKAEALRRALLEQTDDQTANRQGSEAPVDRPDPEQVRRFMQRAEKEGLLAASRKGLSRWLGGIGLAASLGLGYVIVSPLLHSPSGPTLRERSFGQPQLIEHAQPMVQAERLKTKLSPWLGEWGQQQTPEGEVMIEALLRDEPAARHALKEFDLPWPEGGHLLVSIRPKE